MSSGSLMFLPSLGGRRATAGSHRGQLYVETLAVFHAQGKFELNHVSLNQVEHTVLALDPGLT